jgi:hypothetical protein
MPDLALGREVRAALTFEAAVAVLVHAGCPEDDARRIAALERGEGGDDVIDEPGGQPAPIATP